MMTLALLGAMVASLGTSPAAYARGKKIVLVGAHLRPDYLGAQGYAGGPPGPRTPMLVDPGHGFLFGVGIPGLITTALR